MTCPSQVNRLAGCNAPREAGGQAATLPFKAGLPLRSIWAQTMIRQILGWSTAIISCSAIPIMPQNTGAMVQYDPRFSLPPYPHVRKHATEQRPRPGLVPDTSLKIPFIPSFPSWCLTSKSPTLSSRNFLQLPSQPTPVSLVPREGVPVTQRRCVSPDARFEAASSGCRAQEYERDAATQIP